MTKDNLTVGHYASHTNTGNFDINKHGRVIFEVNEVPQLSDIELRTRKEVMTLLDEYIAMDNRRFAGLQDTPDSHLDRIRELLIEMWGE